MKGQTMAYYTYMLRCSNNSIYTGITTDIKRRMEEHFNKSDKCAKYTLNHSAIKLEAAWKSEDRVSASKLEYHIKKLSKRDKEKIIENPDEISKLLGNKINFSINRYTI
jgi:putative endonuclease